MPKIKLTDTEKIARWKEIIIGNLHTRFANGITETEFLAEYPNAESGIITQATQELIAEGKAELV